MKSGYGRAVRLYHTGTPVIGSLVGRPVHLVREGGGLAAARGFSRPAVRDYCTVKPVGGRGAVAAPSTLAANA